MLRTTQAKYIVSVDVMTDQDAGDIILAAKNGDFGTHFHSYLTASAWTTTILFRIKLYYTLSHTALLRLVAHLLSR